MRDLEALVGVRCESEEPEPEVSEGRLASLTQAVQEQRAQYNQTSQVLRQLQAQAQDYEQRIRDAEALTAKYKADLDSLEEKRVAERQENLQEIRERLGDVCPDNEREETQSVLEPSTLVAADAAAGTEDAAEDQENLEAAAKLEEKVSRLEALLQSRRQEHSSAQEMVRLREQQIEQLTQQKQHQHTQQQGTVKMLKQLQLEAQLCEAKLQQTQPNSQQSEQQQSQLSNTAAATTPTS